MTLNELKIAILADRKIDPTEAAQLRSMIFADGVVDKDEMVVLYELNENATASCQEFDQLFVEAGKSCYLSDAETPGVIDAEEAAHIRTAIESDGIIDANERALLTAIKAEATSIDESLVTWMTGLGI